MFETDTTSVSNSVKARTRFDIWSVCMLTDFVISNRMLYCKCYTINIRMKTHFVGKLKTFFYDKPTVKYVQTYTSN